MIKLFISLYLAVVIGLLSINWGSEWLWSSLQGKSELTELQHAITLTKALPALIQSKAENIEKFEKSTGLSLSIMQLDDIAWQLEQQQILTQGDVVISYNNNDQPLFYIKAFENNSLYQLELIESKVIANKHLKLIILTISYLLLAAFIALWTRPIWRDLVKLTQMADHIAAGDLEVTCSVNKSSPTAVIVKTFQNMAQRITRLLSEQKQLVNAVSHELRTPLSRLHFSLAMMNDNTSQQVKDISQDVHEIESLIEEMLNYSRIETLEKNQCKTNVNINELLTNQIDKHQRSTHKKLTLTLKQQADIYFFCDGHLVERAIQNLITNAIRYAKSQVEVSAAIEHSIENKKTKTTLSIAINDDGFGIAQKDRENIFNAFTRLDKSRNKEKGGFGLGLAIVKRITDWHNGSCIISDSALGGAEFTLKFKV